MTAILGEAEGMITFLLGISVNDHLGETKASAIEMAAEGRTATVPDEIGLTTTGEKMVGEGEAVVLPVGDLMTEIVGETEESEDRRRQEGRRNQRPRPLQHLQEGTKNSSL